MHESIKSSSTHLKIAFKLTIQCFTDKLGRFCRLIVVKALNAKLNLLDGHKLKFKTF